jgi:hypothetical protein
MNARLVLCTKYLGITLLFLSIDLPHCGIPTTHSAEVGSSVIITEGKTPQGYPYIYGGVSSGEREIMEERGKSYNVKLSFADKRGPYLAGITLVIEGAKGTEIVNITTDGPWFYIQLPPGTYTVKATFGAKTNELKPFRVAKDKKTQQTLTWDVGEDKDAVSAR